MPQVHAMTLRMALDIAADRIEPTLNAGKQFDLPALCDKVVPIDAHALVFGLLIHEMHVGDQGIGLRLFGKRIALGPESRWVRANFRQEGVLLHRSRRKRTVEIIDEGDGFFVEFRGRHTPGGAVERV